MSRSPRARRRLRAAVVPFVVAVVCVVPPSAATGAELPLGRPGLTETRETRTPAPGVTETEIVRGETSGDRRVS